LKIQLRSPTPKNLPYASETSKEEDFYLANSSTVEKELLNQNK
jgi:hypothetical protein